MIRAENIIRSFKSGDSELTVLKGVSFEVATGEFLSIIGRSGSGKSTLLYQMGLLDTPTSGGIFIDDVNTSELTAEQRTDIRLRDLGYVFQDYALVPELTAVENVMLPLMMQNISNDIARKRAAEVMEVIGLGSRINNLPNQLSGGEQQRVSIARAIAHKPKILFADEPTANLDNDTSLTILDVFRDLHKQGQTIIMVTHEPEYTKFTDRTITLFDGKIVDDAKMPKAH
jgi:putative ABC transport system ATP-binding protein